VGGGGRGGMFAGELQRIKRGGQAPWMKNRDIFSSEV